MENNETLYVFDLDDTLIETTAKIHCTVYGRNYVLTTHEYAELKSADKAQMDFSEFNSFEKLVSEKFKPLFHVWKGLIEGGYNVLLLTAREAKPIIESWLKFCGVEAKEINQDITDFTGSMFCCVHYPSDRLLADPKLPTHLAKRNTLSYILQKHPYHEIHVFEDSKLICSTLKGIERNNTNIKINLHPTN